MNLPVRSSTLDPLVALQQARRLCIPSAADVRGAVALLPKPTARASSRFAHRVTLQSPRVYEGPKWFLDVAPGLVRIRKKLTAEKVNIWDNDGVGDEERSTRGRVTGWSEKSRNRMMQTLESLDYHPMFESGEPAAMVTLTLPGEGDLWERLVPDAPTFKKMVNKFVTSYAMAWGEPLRGVWKMEFQKRGAPHLHILMVPPARDRRAGIRFVNAAGKREDHQLPFSNWAGAKWASIVGATGAARAMHQLIGVDISYSEVYRYSDPRRIGSYFAKHGSFTAKDYQNDMPEHWRAAIIAGESGGANYWGYWGLDKAIETVELQHRPSARRAAIVDGEPVMAHHDLPRDLPWSPDGESGHYVSSNWRGLRVRALGSGHVTDTAGSRRSVV